MNRWKAGALAALIVAGGSLPAAAQQMKAIQFEGVRLVLPSDCSLKARQFETGGPVETVAQCIWTDAATNRLWEVLLSSVAIPARMVPDYSASEQADFSSAICRDASEDFFERGTSPDCRLAAKTWSDIPARSLPKGMQACRSGTATYRLSSGLSLHDRALVCNTFASDGSARVVQVWFSSDADAASVDRLAQKTFASLQMRP